MNIDNDLYSPQKQLALSLTGLSAGVGSIAFAFLESMSLAGKASSSAANEPQIVMGSIMTAATLIGGIKLANAFIEAANAPISEPDSKALHNFKTWTKRDTRVAFFALTFAGFSGLGVENLQTSAEKDRIEAARISTLPKLDPTATINIQARDVKCSETDKSTKKVISVWYKDPGAGTATEHQLRCG